MNLDILLISEKLKWVIQEFATSALKEHSTHEEIDVHYSW